MLMSETGRIRLESAGASHVLIYSNGAPYAAYQWYKVDVTIGKNRITRNEFRHPIIPLTILLRSAPLFPNC